jgi:hypothetical protein
MDERIVEDVSLCPGSPVARGLAFLKDAAQKDKGDANSAAF